MSLCALAGSAWLARRRDPAADLQPWREGTLTLFSPLVLPIWATLASGAEKAGRTPFPWASLVLGILALGTLVAALRVLHRGRRYWPGFLPLVLTVVVADFLGLFVGGMEIVDDWV